MKGRESEEREFPKALHEIDFSCAETKGLAKGKKPKQIQTPQTKQKILDSVSSLFYDT